MLGFKNAYVQKPKMALKTTNRSLFEHDKPLPMHVAMEL